MMNFKMDHIVINAVDINVDLTPLTEPTGC